MASLRRIKITFEIPIRLNVYGYAELVSQIEERIFESGQAYQATAVLLEVELAAGEPQPLTGVPDSDERAPSDEGSD